MGYMVIVGVDARLIRKFLPRGIQWEELIESKLDVLRIREWEMILPVIGFATC